jgi:5-hydroxyisourate hydrolase-like protein (transthyretin family)
VSDAAGNTAPWGPVTIRTRNAACDPGPPAADLRIRAGLARRGKPRRRVTVGYGERVRIVGRLTRTDGTPVAGAPMCVAEKRVGQASRNVSTGPTTDADGRFSYRLERGPSRAVWIVHRVSGAAAAKRLKLAVRPRVSFRPAGRSLRNGDRLSFRGRISGPVPKRGVLVQIQVDRGDHWQTFTSGRANSRGRFTASYRFSRTLGVANYRLRAHVPGQGSYPYAAGSSRPAVVRVDG